MRFVFLILYFNFLYTRFVRLKHPKEDLYMGITKNNRFPGWVNIKKSNLFHDRRAKKYKGKIFIAVDRTQKVWDIESSDTNLIYYEKHGGENQAFEILHLARDVIAIKSNLGRCVQYNLENKRFQLEDCQKYDKYKDQTFLITDEDGKWLGHGNIGEGYNLLGEENVIWGTCPVCIPGGFGDKIQGERMDIIRNAAELIAKSKFGMLGKGQGGAAGGMAGGAAGGIAGGAAGGMAGGAAGGMAGGAAGGMAGGAAGGIAGGAAMGMAGGAAGGMAGGMAGGGIRKSPKGGGMAGGENFNKEAALSVIGGMTSPQEYSRMAGRGGGAAMGMVGGAAGGMAGGAAMGMAGGAAMGMVGGAAGGMAGGAAGGAAMGMAGGAAGGMAGGAAGGAAMGMAGGAAGGMAGGAAGGMAGGAAEGMAGGMAGGAAGGMAGGAAGGMAGGSAGGMAGGAAGGIAGGAAGEVDEEGMGGSGSASRAALESVDSSSDNDLSPSELVMAGGGGGKSAQTFGHKKHVNLEIRDKKIDQSKTDSNDNKMFETDTINMLKSITPLFQNFGTDRSQFKGFQNTDKLDQMKMENEETKNRLREFIESIRDQNRSIKRIG
ncbi:putative Ricin B lectin protein [Pseudoloma neurophilia]|uniref:Putative Ricin B lectin protein n=1 Tax=Pseudoloma neurophilia TaxID=146866 RepID=A0A0R0M3R9_9MICR|nr:putative Ricin B lectin protein [Pseudoloma neurophilia]